MNRHLSDDELLGRVYGLADHDSHLENCAECASRWAAFRQRRRELAQPEPVSIQFLAAQRRAIYSRLGEPSHSRMKWAPAVAAACLLIIGLVVYRPGTAPPVRGDSGDAQLFSDVYSMEQSTEPQAAAPIHELFEDNQ
jgi:hypothetical protein